MVPSCVRIQTDLWKNWYQDWILCCEKLGGEGYFGHDVQLKDMWCPSHVFLDHRSCVFSCDVAPFCRVTTMKWSICHHVCANLSIQHVELFHWTRILCTNRPCGRVCLHISLHAHTHKLLLDLICTLVFSCSVWWHVIHSDVRKLVIHI